MRIIEIAAQSNGAHRNQSGDFSIVPDGWALIPSSVTVPDTFPFVNIEVKGKVVTAMSAGVVPNSSDDDSPNVKVSVWDELDAAYQEGVDSV